MGIRSAHDLGWGISRPEYLPSTMAKVCRKTSVPYLDSGKDVVDAAGDLPLQKGEIELVYCRTQYIFDTKAQRSLGTGQSGGQLLGTVCNKAALAI